MKHTLSLNLRNTFVIVWQAHGSCLRLAPLLSHWYLFTLIIFFFWLDTKEERSSLSCSRQSAESLTEQCATSCFIGTSPPSFDKRMGGTMWKSLGCSSWCFLFLVLSTLMHLKYLTLYGIWSTISGGDPNGINGDGITPKPYLLITGKVQWCVTSLQCGACVLYSACCVCASRSEGIVKQILIHCWGNPISQRCSLNCSDPGAPAPQCLCWLRWHYTQATYF